MSMSTEQCHQVIVDVFSDRSGVELLKAIAEGGSHDSPNPQGQGQQLPWCICQKCRMMTLPEENRCCRRVPCITTAEQFHTNVLNVDVLSIAMVSRSDIRAETPDYTPASYRKACYRQWIMWQHGFLGRSNRRVVPSCVVWAVSNKFPVPDGNYMGFKEY